MNKNPSLLITDLVGSYSFNNNLVENTGLSPNGVRTGGSGYFAGVFGNAINNTNTADSCVDVADDNNFSFTTGGGNDVPFSISLFAYFTAFSSTGNWLINKRDATSGGDEWQIIYLGGQLYFMKYDRTNNTIYQGIATGTGLISTGNWYHIVCTDDGSKTVGGMKIYLDSTLLTTTDISSGTYTGMNNGTQYVRIGNAGWDLSGNFLHQGFIDECNIYKGRELNSTEITELNTKAYPF